MLFYKTLNFITFVSLKTIRISWTFSVLLTGSLIERRWIRRTSEENELKPAHDRSVRTRTTATRSFVFTDDFSCLLTPINARREKKLRALFLWFELYEDVYSFYSLYSLYCIHWLHCMHWIREEERKKEATSKGNEHRTSNIARKSTLSQSLS